MLGVYLQEWDLPDIMGMLLRHAKGASHYLFRLSAVLQWHAYLLALGGCW